MGAGVSTHSGNRRGLKNGAADVEPRRLDVTHHSGRPLPEKFGRVVVPEAIPAALPPPPPHSTEVDGRCVWFVEDLDRPGEWEAYATDVCERLDAARRSGQSECAIVAKRRMCTVNLRTMEQRAPGATARPRRVKCVEVESAETAAHERRYADVDPFCAEIWDEEGEGAETETMGAGNRGGLREEEERETGSGNRDASKLPVLLRSVTMSGAIFTMMYAKDGSTLLTGTRQELLHWDVKTSTVLTSFDVGNCFVLAAVYSSDGRRVVCSGDDPKIRIYNTTSPAVRATFKGHDSRVYGVEFLAGEERLASVSVDRHVRCWDVERQSCLQVIKCHKGPIFALTTSKVSDWFALTCGDDKIIYSHDFRLGTKSVTAEYAGHSKALWTCALRGDEQQFATAGLDANIRVWDVRKPNASVLTISHHARPVHFLEYMPHDRGILSCSRDATARLTDTLTGNTIWRANAHEKSVFRVLYHPEAQLMVTGALDSKVNVWGYGNVDGW